MIPMPKIENEEERLQTLFKYKILDTLSEQVFDNITQMAANICGTPVALISFVDQDRQWFKSHHGVELTETPRNIAFCVHAIHQKTLFEVKDAANDPRFHDNPLVTGDAGIRYYAGMPLIARNGHPLGTLCVIDVKPNSLTDAQKDLLQGLANHVMGLLELRISHSRIGERNSHLNTLLQSMSEGMLMVNAAEMIVDHNQSAMRILGVPEGDKLSFQLLTRYWRRFEENGTLTFNRESPVRAAFRTGEAQANVLLGLGDADRATQWISFSAAPVRDEFSHEVSHVICTFSDVTTLSKSYETAQLAVKAKSEFMANISHEIRTPLNGVVGMCNLLLSEVKEPATLDKLKVIQSCGSSLMNLLASVLDYSKLEAGKMEIEKAPFALPEVTKEVIDLMSASAFQKNIRVVFRPERQVMNTILGDSTRFRQVLTNLLSNAIKFTEVGEIEISSKIVGTENEESLFEFSVRDTGIGISSDIAKNLFLSFSQADASTTRKYGGSGLGLAISKGICEQMGGTIRIESVVGEGSTFIFSFRAALVAGKKLSLVDHKPFVFDSEMGKKHPLRILVAEDNSVNQQVLMGALRKLGYDPSLADNGLKVLEKMKEQTFDLILMDCHMPHLDGFQTTLRIYEQTPADYRPKIIAVTASATPEDIEDCFAYGMSAFISKPIAVSILVDELSQCKRIEINQRDVFDEPAFSQNFQGMEDIAAGAIQNFIQVIPELLQNVENSIQEMDARKLQIAAHTLKGTLSNFRAPRATQAALELEMKAKANELSVAPALLNRIQREVKYLQPILEKLFQLPEVLNGTQ